MMTKKGSKSKLVVLFLVVGIFVFVSVLYIMAAHDMDLNVINLQSYPAVGDNWTVGFTTKGSADLTIRAIDTEFGRDLEFIELRCGDNVLTAKLNNGIVFVEDYSCDETGYVTSKVSITGEHTLEFRFGSNFECACVNKCDFRCKEGCKKIM